jgi:serine/threonine-protein kinase
VDGLLGRPAGNYTLVKQIGAGAMGEVFHGINPALDAHVAIKVLQATGSDADRFLTEARAVNRVQHEGVVKIQDGGYLDIGRPYLVMELLDGESLEQLLARTKRPPPARALKIIDDLLDVIAAAHAAGIVHRDLKPANVFLTRTGRTLVLDFGVAKLLDGSGSVTRTGAMVGTPAYMAPEQIHAGTVDGRTDVYAAGVILFELLAGTRPFHGSTSFAIAQAHVSQPIPRLPGDVDARLQRVIDDALAKQPDQRFASARAMRDALALPARRARWWMPVAGALAAGGIVVAIAATRGGGERDEPAPAPAPAPVAVAAAPAPVIADAAVDAAAPADAAIASTDPDADVEQLLRRAKFHMIKKRLVASDLEGKQVLYKTATDALAAKDYAGAKAAATELNAAIDAIVVDGAFVARKAIRLVEAHKNLDLSVAVRQRLVSHSEAFTRRFRENNYEAANRELNLQYDILKQLKYGDGNGPM